MEVETKELLSIIHHLSSNGRRCYSDIKNYIEEGIRICNRVPESSLIDNGTTREDFINSWFIDVYNISIKGTLEEKLSISLAELMRICKRHNIYTNGLSNVSEDLLNEIGESTINEVVRGIITTLLCDDIECSIELIHALCISLDIDLNYFTDQRLKYEELTNK